MITLLKTAGIVAALVVGTVVNAFTRRPLLTALFIALLVTGVMYADGTVSSPPACEQAASWKIIYNHENAPLDGAPANAVVRVAYISATNKVLDSEDINLTGSDFTSFISAQTVAAVGENGSWGAGRKKLYRMSKWLVDNAKLTKCSSCVVVG